VVDHTAVVTSSNDDTSHSAPAEGAGNVAGHKRQRYQTALGSAREVLACVQVAQAMRYIGAVDERTLDRMDHVIATLTRLVHRRA
jgi:hypothetical protein